MTNDKQVEVWRKEFESYFCAHSRLDNGRYIDPTDQSRWVCWLAAKRSMPPIDLPEGHLMNDPDGLGRGRYLMVESVERAINRAGYSYKVK